MPMLLSEAAAITVDFSPYTTALTSSISPADLIAVLASVVGVGMAFFLAWLGVRKATNTFATAVSTGRIRI